MKTICNHTYPSDLCGICNPPAKKKADSLSDATPEMDSAAYEATTRTVGKWIVPLANARELERQRNIAIAELLEENRTLKDQLAYLSKSKATEILQLSDMIDKREEALGHIAAIMRGKNENGEDLIIGSTAWKSVIRWSVYFQNVESIHPESKP